MIERNQLRTALRAWHDTVRLGSHPLAALLCVAAAGQALGHDDTPTGRGLTLRHLLRGIIDELRPNLDPPDFSDRRWRPYLILTEQFINLRSPQWVAAQLFIAKRTYHKEQARALDEAAAALEHREQKARSRSAEAAPPAWNAPFLAPPRIRRPFVGRTDLLDEIRRRLLTDDGRRLALVGLPGVGKTTLLRELAHDPAVRAAFPDGVLWAGLGQTPDSAALLAGWARALGCGDEELNRARTIAARAALVHARIGSRRMLLLIDDGWRGEDALAFQLGGPHCSSVLTTRLRHVAYDFAGSDTIGLSEFDPAESLTYLQTTVGPTSISRDELRRLAENVGGLPLALSLIVRYLLHHGGGLNGALTALDSAESRLSLAQPQSPLLQDGASRSLRATIAMSARSLTPAALGALATLALLPPKPASFARDAAVVMAGDPAALVELEKAGLVEPLGVNRLALHQTIVDFAADFSAETGDPDRVMAAYLAFLEQNRADDDTLDVEFDNIVRALDLTVAQGRIETLCRCMVLFNGFCERRSHVQTAQRYLEAAEAGLSTSIPSSLQAALLHALGLNATARGAYFSGVAAIERSMALDRAGELALQNQRLLSTLNYRLGDLARAEQHARAGLSLAKAAGDDVGMAQARLSIGRIMSQQGLYAEAADIFETLIAAARQIDDPWIESIAWHNLGFSHLQRHELSTAAKSYQQAVALCRRIGYRRGECRALNDLGAVAGQQYDLAEAQRRYQASLVLSREIGDRSSVAITLSNLANITMDGGMFEEAAHYLQQSLATSAGSGDLRVTGSAEIHACKLGWLIGDVDAALAAGERALSIARDIDDAGYELESLLLLVAVDLDRRAYDHAVGRCEKALELARRSGPRDMLAEALIGAAAAAHGRGDGGVPELLAEVTALEAAGVEIPLHAAWLRYRVTRALDDLHAEKILETAYNRLLLRAERMTEPRLRQSFLQNVPHNREIREAFLASVPV